jgi:triosephosphate isomerase
MAVRALIAGNWKMNTSLADARSLAAGIAAQPSAAADLLLCPPAPWLQSVASEIGATGVMLGGQDCHPASAGAHTGDISAEMLAEIGCSHVIVGHSERRTDHGESDAQVQAKADAALRAGLVAVICVGESEAERDAGRALAVVGGQLAGSIPAAASANNTVIAYEPVWAIGTGRTPTVQDVAAMHDHMRTVIADKISDAAHVKLLYGGSVKPANAAELLAVANVNGALVGGASLQVEDFLAIAAAV